MSWSMRIKSHSDNVEKPTPEVPIDKMAKVFRDLSDEQQAQFFIEVCKVSKLWEGDHLQQWYAVGRHLKTCKCSDEYTREMIEALYKGVT